MHVLVLLLYIYTFLGKENPRENNNKYYVIIMIIRNCIEVMSNINKEMNFFFPPKNGQLQTIIVRQLFECAPNFGGS